MAITFGSGGAPSQVTLNLDSLFGTSLAAYNKTLVDNIGATNAFLHQMLKSKYYRSQDGGSYIQIPLMYQLGTADSYDGYDELVTTPMDGITDAIYQWRQTAVQIAYSMKEVKQNKQRILDLVKTKIQQAELGMQESWAQAFMTGAGDGALGTPKTSSSNGSSWFEPLNELIAFDPTATATVGNIPQGTNSWWRNKTKTSAATSTYDSLLLEFQNIYNSAALGTGGAPDLILVDQVSYELLTQAIYQRWRQIRVDENFPFENTMFKKARIVMDDKTPDAFSGTASTSVYGTAYFFNTQFFEIKYESDSNFTMLKDDQGKTFQKPINGDSRVGHIGWMGNVCCSNRRKQAIYAKIVRSGLT